MRRVRKIVRPAHWAVASVLPGALQRHYLHWVGTGRWGDFSSPRTFNEKINWRILHDRRRTIADACDKLRMKETARRLVPDEGRLRIPRTIWAGTDPDRAPVDAGEPWIMKPNHSSGEVLHSDEADASEPERCRDWLVSKPGRQLGEWGYQVARPLLLMEELIPSEDGRSPDDYKFFVFDGVPRLVQVNRGRFSADASVVFYDPEGGVLPLRSARTPAPRADAEELPTSWSAMVALAAELAANWDFMRVDLYSVGGQVWFGEYSPYPGGGVTRYQPSSWDRRIGDWWRISPA